MSYGLKLFNRFLWVSLGWINLDGQRLFGFSIFVVVDYKSFCTDFWEATLEIRVLLVLSFNVNRFTSTLIVVASCWLTVEHIITHFLCVKK